MFVFVFETDAIITGCCKSAGALKPDQQLRFAFIGANTDADECHTLSAQLALQFLAKVNAEVGANDVGIGV